MNLSWDISVLMDGYHVIGGVKILQGSQDDAVMEFQLLRSRRNKYCVFNWPSQYYALPTRPVAMRVFENRLYCFDIGVCYVLNNPLGPHTLLEGIGCISQKSVVATESGMMVAADRQVWFHNRRGFQDIGTPIMKIVNNSGTDLGYLQKASDDPCCMYDSHYNLFMLAYRVSTSTIIVCLYDPRLQRWSMMEATSGTSLSLGFTAPTGRVFLNIAASLHLLFRASTTRASEFISKDFEFDPYQTKFFEIAVRGDKPTLWWSEDGGTEFSVTLTTDTGSNVHRGIINSSPRTVAGTQWLPTTVISN